MTPWRRWVSVGGLVAGCAVAWTAMGQQLLIGQCAPLSRSHGFYGCELERGLRAGFAALNASGAIAGRQVERVVLDDDGRPERAVANTRVLLDSGVLSLAGYQGAASIEASLPMIFNLRAGAWEVAAAVVKLVKDASNAEVHEAVAAACRIRPQALVRVLDSRNALEAIRTARRESHLPQFYAISEAGALLVVGASPTYPGLGRHPCTGRLRGVASLYA